MTDSNWTSERLGLLLTTRLGYRFANRPIANPEDLAPRIEILRRTAMRSVEALAGFDLTWVIQTDPSLRSFLRSQVEDGAIGAPPGVDVHVVAREGIDFDMADLAVLDSKPGRFLCARLDSDDYYLPGAMAEALRRTYLATGTLVDFPRGYLVDATSGFVQRHSYVAQGPFYGIVTNASDPLPAVGNHVHARDGRTAIAIKQRAWLQTVHSDNYLTTIDSASAITRARTMRREITRGGSTRPWRESARRPLDLVPLRRSSQSRLAETVGA